MKALLIEPRDGLIARDARPFDAGGSARSLPFPLPGTLSGAVQTRARSDETGAYRDGAPLATMRGPLLVRRDSLEFLPSAPLDAVLTKTGALHALEPRAATSGEWVNLEGSVQPVQMTNPTREKPEASRKFWRWSDFEAWLSDTAQRTVNLESFGFKGLPTAQRLHTALNDSTLTVENGLLFATTALYFRDDEGLSANDLALYVETNASSLMAHKLWTLGGERRLAHFEEVEPRKPALPDAVLERVVRERGCRVILLTPAYFKGGWKPQYLLESRHGVTPQLIGAAVGRPVTVSGWYAKSKHPDGMKPSRRLAPAGSAYFLRLEGTPHAIRNWLEQTWWQNVSDEDSVRDGDAKNFAARKEGYGLAVIGTWNPDANRGGQ
jgi:CRISPR-associated protein Cmr3